MPLPRRLRSLSFLFLYICAAAFTKVILSFYPGKFIFEPIVVIPGVVGLIFAACAGDFFYYWMHRCQHRIPYLWKYHSIHHSIEAMGAGTGYQHVTQPLIEAVLIAIPASLFVDHAQAEKLPMFIGFLGYYIHSNSRLNAGPLRAVLIDNRMHRIHHSREAKHYDKNFGVVTSIWDRLFGTAYFPAEDEWPATGLADRREPQTVLEFLFPSRTVRLAGTGDSSAPGV
jgi:sterol desaturase/sphingolipid hydroxylase (fatty acid hydroxylase superfamily)